MFGYSTNISLYTYAYTIVIDASNSTTHKNRVTSFWETEDGFNPTLTGINEK